MEPTSLNEWIATQSPFRTPQACKPAINWRTSLRAVLQEMVRDGFATSM